MKGRETMLCVQPGEGPIAATFQELTEMKMDMHAHESMRAIHAVDGGARAGTRQRGWLPRLLERIERAERRRRDYETLMAKTDYELSDIGLTRADVVAGFEYERWPARRGHQGC